MNITINPVNGGFIDRILYFNVSDKPFKKHNVFNKENVHLAIVINEFVIGIDLDEYKFYLYSPDTNDYYGPYNTYQEMICKHLFGKIDGLFSLLSNIKFNAEYSVYEFEYEDFIYNPLTYRLTASIKKTAEAIKETLRYVDKPFVITKQPQTVFKAGVIDSFLVSLNRVFEKDFFPFKEEKNEFSLLARIPGGYLYGNRASKDGNNFVAFNVMPHRPMVVYIPVYVYPGYLKVVNTLDDTSVFKKLFETGVSKTISNLNDLLKVKDVFGINITSKEVVLDKWDIDKYIQMVIPSIDGKIFIIVKVDGKYYTCEFDLITKVIFLKEFTQLSLSNYVCKNIGDKHILVTDSDTKVATTDGDIYIKNGVLDLHIELKKGIAYNHNEVYALTFLKNIRGL